MEKITGLYSYYDNEKKLRMFVYTYEDSNGNIKYGFTDDVDKARKLTFDLLKARGCKPEEDIDEKLNDNIFNLNCKDTKDVFEHIKKANKNVKLNSDVFDEAKDEYDKEAKGSKFSRILNKGKNLGSTILNLPKKVWYRFKDMKLAKKIVVAGAFVVAIATSLWTFSLNKSKSPTNDGPKVAITDGIGDLDKAIDKATEQKEEEKTAEATEVPQVTVEQSSNDYSYDIGWTQPINGGSNITTLPSIVENSMPEFQDPNVSIDEPVNNPTLPSEPEIPEDPYENVNEGEEDNNYQEGEEPGNDYSEEIDVPAGGEDGTTTEDDVILDDEHKGNEGAIDILPGDGDYEIDFVDPNTPLPDPNNTANGDYVTSDEELQQNNNGQQSPEITGEVPVYQDENITTINTTATTTPTDLETAVDNAVEAMANGETGNIVVNTDGSIGFEQDTNAIEANSMTK